MNMNNEITRKVILFSNMLICCFIIGCSGKHVHSIGEQWIYDDEYHWHELLCGHDEMINKNIHEFKETIIEPTFEEDGYTLCQCVDCGYSYNKSIVDKLTHNYSYIPLYNENSHWYYCIDTGYESLKIESNHDFEMIIVKPTYKEDGYTKYQCKICDYYYIDDIVCKLIDVYLIAGQSNALGSGMDTDNIIAKSDRRFTNGFGNVLYFGFQEWWGNVGYPNSSFEPVKLGYGVSNLRSGAEIGIANALKDEDKMSAVIKCAWAGTCLYPDTYNNVSKTVGTWTSSSYIKENNVDLSANNLIGNMYNRFIETVSNGITLLIEDGYTPVIRGVLWMQGEGEMYSLQMANEYGDLLSTLILDFRNDLSELTGNDYSELPFICGLPKWNDEYNDAPKYQTIVRTSIITVATNGKLKNVDYIDTRFFTRHDEWHFDALGQKTLGELFVSKVTSIQ